MYCIWVPSVSQYMCDKCNCLEILYFICQQTCIYSTQQCFLFEGNFFIMDTEQVVSNPYQDLQAEAVDNSKKSSNTERLASVRNNVCEYNLKTKQTFIERQRTHSLRNIHMDASNLRYQVKVMDLNKRKFDLDLQKRMKPKKDFSYDSRQINNSAKRLGISSENSFYLDKKLTFPLRGIIVKDHDQKPIIKKARRQLVDFSTRKKTEKERGQPSRASDRATTAHTVSTTVELRSPEPAMKQGKRAIQRAGSKSAPPPKASYSEPPRPNSRLTAIDEVDAKLPSISNSAAGRMTSKSHVKFNVNNKPVTNSSQDGMFRSKTFHSGMPSHSRTQSYTDWESDSDDEYMYCEKVDLRALFFGDKPQNQDTKSTGSGTTTPHTKMSADTIPGRRCSTAKTPKVTEEMMIKEQTDIKFKVSSFLGSGKKPKAPAKREEPKLENRKQTEQNNDMMSKAAVLLSVFTKPLDPAKMWGFVPSKKKVEVKVEEKSNDDDKKPKENENDNNKKNKKLWELIKTSVQTGNIHRKYTANDLLLQQLTGILVQADKKPKVPIHAASRALRHTPTFKMRRIVEELTKQRTRYEQQEVEKLQKAEGMYPNGEPTRAWETPANELEQAA